MLNEQSGPSTSRKRRFDADKVDSIIRRRYGNQNIDPSITQTGPIYPFESESFTLNEKFISNCPDEVWSETNPNGIVPVVVNPELVRGRNGLELTDDQKSGIQFLWDRYEQQSGGILAHDMGLGKTRTCITVIATLLQQSSRSKGKSQPALRKAIIIAPKNAVTVWKDEFDKWCPENSVCNVVTIMSSDKNGWNTVNDFGKKNSYYNVLILSYESFQKYITTYDDGFTKYVPDSIGLVICDEAHYLKNANTKKVKALKKFAGAKMWFGITGTPYQNNLDEICSLLQFFCKNLEPYDFKRTYCKPINDTLRKFRKLDHNSQLLLMELRSMLRPALHYKTNSFDIERHDVTLFVALDGHPDYFKGSELGEVETEQVQHRLYELICESLASTKEITFNEKLSYVNKACIHPQEAYKALLKHPLIFDSAIKYYEDNFPLDDENGDDPREKFVLHTYSTKIRVATQMAQHIRDKPTNEKMIIVSGSTKLLKRIAEVLIILNMKSVTYDGEKSDRERENATNSFENDEDVRILLLSLKAGGTALTLTRANHLLLLDPDYNPSNDRQAFGRIYRPGQIRTAYIYRILCTGTLEEVKLIRQLEKEAMGNTFKAEDKDVDYNVQAMYDEKEMLQYFSQTRSHVNDILDKMQITEFNDDEDTEGSNFANDIKRSRKYRDVCELPDQLKILRDVWDSVSYCFHSHKSIDELVQFVWNDQFEIIDGEIVYKAS